MRRKKKYGSISSGTAPIAFVDKNNLCTFLPDSAKYIFWCPGLNGQSIKLIYNWLIIPIFNTSGTITISIPDNDIFHLLDPSNISDDISLDTVQCSSYSVTLQEIGSYYGTVIYIIAKSDSVGEFTEKIYINDVEYTIGADFYGEDERLSINLLNMGQEISQQITKAIWETDIYETNIDYTILNRKFKELLSNYWDIIAGKGNYKSLENSLKWFEWENTEIREIWKAIESGLSSDWDLNKIITDELKILLTEYTKTTYISISTALKTLYTENDETLYTNDLNPILENISYIWTTNELRLKIALLRSFFAKYFMPIHLDLLYASVEDWCFLPTMKGNTTPGLSQNILINLDGDIEVTINSTYYITGNISVQANSETLFYDDSNKTEYDDIILIGVDTDYIATGNIVSITVNNISLSYTEE